MVGLLEEEVVAGPKEEEAKLGRVRAADVAVCEVAGRPISKDGSSDTGRGKRSKEIVSIVGRGCGSS